MARFELKLSDEIIAELEKKSVNKSDFVRQAIIEKLSNGTAVNRKENKTLSLKINKLEDKLISLEKTNFLFNKKIENQNIIAFKLLEEAFKLNVMAFELHDQQNKEKYKDKLQQYVDAKIELFKNDLANTFKE